MADQYRSCCLRACPKRSAPGSGVSGLPLHSLALRPADSLAARGGFRRWASAVRSPSLPPSKLRGFGLLPRQASYSCWTRQPLLAARDLVPQNYRIEKAGRAAGTSPAAGAA